MPPLLLRNMILLAKEFGHELDNDEISGKEGQTLHWFKKLGLEKSLSNSEKWANPSRLFLVSLYQLLWRGRVMLIAQFVDRVSPLFESKPESTDYTVSFFRI